ncbi:toxin-antitoxin system antitoxin subunit [bacterium D16-51]|nr:toxin-antitoxin system antitoxin subunit [bacterium D16-59]RKI59592.1 toxin-antitoxin system antitoxin subunit [bacterium D16-51]
MKSKSMKRFDSFCRSLENLAKSRLKNPEDDMVLEATVHRFNLSFDLSWKVMKDILTEHMGVLDFATGSPRETLQTAFANGIINDDVWLKMMRTRNKLAHDYDGILAADEFEKIIGTFYEIFTVFQENAKKYYMDETASLDRF